MSRALIVAALLSSAAALAGCTAAATAALDIAGTVVVKAFNLDAAIIDDIKARRDAAADPNMKGVPGFDPRAAGQPGAAQSEGSRK